MPLHATVSDASKEPLNQPVTFPGVSRRSTTSLKSETHPQTPADLDENVQNTLEQSHPRSRRLESIRPSQLRHPKSQYCNYVPPLPVCDEERAVKDLRQQGGKASDLTEFELSNFVVYLPDNRHHAYEIAPLQDLCSKASYSNMLFDGVLRVGDTRRYVQAVPFDICSIGNYGKEIHAVGDTVWIRSKFLAKSNIYYRLKSPAPEYARFYDGFLWLANLAKHFVDYCQWSVSKKKKVSVLSFRADFSQWIQKRHGESPAFQLWYQEYQGHDFRQAVAANIQFLWKESIGIDGNLRIQPIWNELLEKNAVPVQQPKETKTIVTPYVYDCFGHLRFGHLLKSVAPKNSRQSHKHKHARTSTSKTPRSKASPPREVSSNVKNMEQKIRSIEAGDVLSVTKDSENSKWQDEATRWKTADDCWYIYVQAVHESRAGKRSFAGLWLYKSSDTCCAKMKYPFPNELFLSNNCTCLNSHIQEGEVLDIIPIEWHCASPTSQQGLFIRQTYLENDRFETLKEEHKTCGHLRQPEHTPEPVHSVGQTVLAPPPRGYSRHNLEPYEIVSYVKDETKTMVVLKHLLRRNEMAGQSGHRPNELVYSERTHETEATLIECTCLVRFYSEANATELTIPTPYDRDGTGNAFYITTRLVENEGDQKLEPIQTRLPRTLLQGFDPTEKPPCKMLRGLDLYCGGGNFGRGLEEGGMLHNEWAVDFAKTAMHSYYANLKVPSTTKLFCGSVDDQLYEAFHGNPKRSNLIPMPGEVDFISAGSPCQGFSALNPNKNNDKGLKNQSLVASVAAYIDFYRPKYGLLENVMTMAQKGSGRDDDVLSQLICAIVGMGYQLRIFVLDAWSLGSPQSRSRLFVSFAAPDLQPIEHPQLSHSHPAHVTIRGLGKLANGESFGHRMHCPTPFEYLTAYEATKDLPDIGDGQTSLCVPYPDHAPRRKPTKDLRSQMNVIPKYPRGSCFASAWKGGCGVMTQGQRALFPSITSSGKIPHCVQSNSKACGRINPDKLFPTIVVNTYPMDARMGKCLHWDQPRMITVMEARRAQGFPDDEVLVGSVADKWKVIGNSVPRTVSLALGLSIRKAWLQNSSRQEANTDVAATKAILSATQSKVEAIDRLKQPGQTRPGLRSLSVGRPLGRSPLQPIARISSITKITAASGDRPVQTVPLKQGHNIAEETKILPPSNSLKRRHSMIEDAAVSPPERNYKALKVSSRAFDLFTPPTRRGSRGGKTKVLRDSTGCLLGASSDRKSLDNVLNKQVSQNSETFLRNGSQDLEFDVESLAYDDDADGLSILDTVVSSVQKTAIQRYRQ